MVTSAIRGCTLVLLVTALVAGCKKQEAAATANAAPMSEPESTAPGPAPTPATPVVIAPDDNGDVKATLAQLTRELHRTMIGRKLSGSFEEFVAIRNLSVPPPPPGKKYIITKQWRVDLADK